MVEKLYSFLLFFMRSSACLKLSLLLVCWSRANVRIWVSVGGRDPWRIGPKWVVLRPWMTSTGFLNVHLNLSTACSYTSNFSGAYDLTSLGFKASQSSFKIASRELLRGRKDSRTVKNSLSSFKLRPKRISEIFSSLPLSILSSIPFEHGARLNFIKTHISFVNQGRPLWRRKTLPQLRIWDILIFLLQTSEKKNIRRGTELDVTVEFVFTAKFGTIHSHFLFDVKLLAAVQKKILNVFLPILFKSS